MNYFIPSSLKLGDANTTTLYVLWSMIIFLVVLICGIGFAFFQQLKRPQSYSNKKQVKNNASKSKGF